MNKTVKKISFTALFAAMVFGLTMQIGRAHV